MAIRKKTRCKKNNLPTGISLRKDGFYVVRKTYKGQKAQKVVATKEEALQTLKDIEYELKHGIYYNPDKIILNTWYDEWIETYKRPDCKESSIDDYNSYYNSHIRSQIGNLKIGEITTVTIQRLLNNMQEKRYSQSSIDKTYLVLHMLFKQAVKLDMINRNPCQSVTKPKGIPKQNHIALTVEQQSIFLANLNPKSNYTALLKVMLFTGMRLGEVSALQWCDIDFQNKLIHVRHTMHTKHRVDNLTSAKTKRSIRDIPMIPQVIEILRQKRNQEKVIQINGLVFHTKNGRAYEHNGVNAHLCSIKKKIQKKGFIFPNITSHDLRDTFATRAIENGMNPQTLRDILGHSSLAMTMDLYAHVMENTKIKEMDAISIAF